MPAPLDLLKGYTFSGNLVIFCSDERFVFATIEFLKRDRGVTRFDLMAVAGGPLFLKEGEKNLLERYELLLKVHRIQNLYLFAHQDCGYYRSLYPELGQEKLLEKEQDDLRAIKESLQGQGMRLHAYMARVKGKEIVFDEL